MFQPTAGKSCQGFRQDQKTYNYVCYCIKWLIQKEGKYNHVVMLSLQASQVQLNEYLEKEM